MSPDPTPRNSDDPSRAADFPRHYHDAGSDVPASIPDKATLQPVDLHGATTTEVDDVSWGWLRPPQPGAAGPYPSTILRRSERTVSAILDVDERPTVVLEYLAVYHSNGAHRYLRDLRRALEPGHGAGDRPGRWKILATCVAGPDSVLLRLREDIESAGGTKVRDTYVAVARVGRLLVVVADTGGKSCAAHRGLVEELIPPAVRRASVLL